MIYLITNISFECQIDPSILKIINHNPWGFSRKNIKEDFIAKLLDIPIGDQDLFILSIEPYFFGNRIEIIKNTLMEFSSKIKIMTRNEVKIFLAENKLPILI